MSTIFAFFTSKLLMPLLGLITIVGGAFLGFTSGKRSERKNTKIKDLENARELRNKVDAVSDDYGELTDADVIERLRDARRKTRRDI